jgi:RNA polymerase sigma factor (TIGR02999 family)
VGIDQREPAGDLPPANNHTNELVEATYTALRNVAHAMIARQGPGLSLEATVLLHEAFMRLAAQERALYNDETHFKRVAAKMLRRTLVDLMRRHWAQKRGNHYGHMTLSGVADHSKLHRIDVLALDEALERLAAIEARWASIVELKFFGAMELGAIADMMGISRATVCRDWERARAWLEDAIEGGDTDDAPDHG